MPFKWQHGLIAGLQCSFQQHCVFFCVSVWTAGKSHAIVNNKPWCFLLGRRLNTIPRMPKDGSRANGEDAKEWAFSSFTSEGLRDLMFSQRYCCPFRASGKLTRKCLPTSRNIVVKCPRTVFIRIPEHVGTRILRYFGNYLYRQTWILIDLIHFF